MSLISKYLASHESVFYQEPDTNLKSIEPSYKRESVTKIYRTKIDKKVLLSLKF